LGSNTRELATGILIFLRGGRTYDCLKTKCPGKYSDLWRTKYGKIRVSLNKEPRDLYMSRKEVAIDREIEMHSQFWWKDFSRSRLEKVYGRRTLR
jgi:hypothetical protein